MSLELDHDRFAPTEPRGRTSTIFTVSTRIRRSSQNGHVLDVEEIVAHLLGDLLEADRVAEAHLGPAGESRAHDVAERVVGDLLRHGLHVRQRSRDAGRPGPCRPSGCSRTAAARRGAACESMRPTRVIRVRIVAVPDRDGALAGRCRCMVRNLTSRKGRPVQPGPLVDEEDRAARVELDGERDDGHQRRGRPAAPPAPRAGSTTRRPRQLEP